MQVFRITKKKYQGDLTGKGAELFGGRWNPIGIPALYTSETRALSALELLVHTPTEILPPKYIMQTIDIPDRYVTEIIILEVTELVNDWDLLQHSESTENIGLKYFQTENKIGIKVPSTIIKQEFNIVLNPLHKSYKKIRVIEESDFNIDERLLK